MLDRLKIGTHITLFPEWLIEWEYRAMDFDVGAERSGGNISYEVNHESFKKFRILVEKAISEL